MTGVLEVVGKVAGIGGVALGVFLLLYRDLIRKTIFPQLTKNQAYRFLTLIAILTWLVALAGIFTWAFVATRPTADASATREALVSKLADSKLEIVDVLLTDADDGTTATIDVKLRNTGQTVAFAKAAHFDVKRIWSLGLPVMFDAVPVSAQYDVSFPMTTAPYTKATSISQEIPPNGVDRFAFRIAIDDSNDPSGPVDFASDKDRFDNENDELVNYVVQFSLAIAYDEDDKLAVTQDVFILLAPAVEVQGYAEKPSSVKRLAWQHGRSVAQSLRELEGLKSKNLQNEMQPYLGDDPFQTPSVSQ